MSDHETLIAVAARWEALYNEAREESERLKAHDGRYEEVRLAFEMHHEMTYHEMCAVLVERDTLIAALTRQVGELQGILIDNTHALRTVVHGYSGALPCTPKEAWELTLAEAADTLIAALKADVEALQKLLFSVGEEVDWYYADYDTEVAFKAFAAAVGIPEEPRP